MFFKNKERLNRNDCKINEIKTKSKSLWQKNHIFQSNQENLEYVIFTLSNKSG